MERESYTSKSFWIVVGVFSVFLLILFYYEATGRITSDLVAHMQAGAAQSGYSLLHNIFYIESRSGWYDVWASFTLTACIVITGLVVKQLLVENLSTDNMNRYLVDFFAVSLLIVSMIVLPGVLKHWYLGQGTPNPWHNPTYILSRLFGVISILYFIRVYKRGLFASYRNLLCFAASLTLATYAKPSFPSIFMPAVMTMLMADWCFYKKRETIIMILGMGLLFLPSVGIVLLQSSIVFGENQGGKLVFILGNSWSMYSKNIPLSILSAYAFPLFIFFTKRSSNALYKLGLLCLAYGTFFFTFMGESGARETHLNMAWGLYLGLFFAFIASVSVLIEKRFDRKWAQRAFVLYGLHLLSGVVYLIRYMVKGTYY